MSACGRFCCKSRKSNDSENLAKVDFRMAVSLQSSRSANTKVRGRFSAKRCGPSRREARDASAALKNFVRHLKKTFATKSAHLRHGAMPELSPLTGCKAQVRLLGPSGR